MPTAIAPPPPSPRFGARAFGAIGRTFRGEIYEDDRDVPMIPAYSNDGQPFDIETCCYWKEPFQMANRTTTRLMVLRAANQIFKTGVCEMIGKHKIKHDPGHMCFYDMTIEACEDHAKSRLMPMFKSIPGLGEIIRDIQERNRFEVTTTDILLPGMILRVRPLNEASTQRITLRYIFIHDAALSERSGQIRRARVRATQYAGRELVVIESQGGVVSEGIPDDFTAAMNETDERRLWVTCPHCGGAQPFVWNSTRPDDFVAKPPQSIPSLDHDAWLNDRMPKLMKPENRLAGFKTSIPDLFGQPFDEREVMRSTHYECLHCGEPWPDDGDNGPIRRALDKSSHYVPTRTNVLPGHYGYSIPVWINTRIRWGRIMLEKIRADLAAEAGDELLLQDWTQKRAGETWNPEATRVKFAPVTATIDPQVAIPNELFRRLDVDCQKDRQLSAIRGEDMTGHFWVSAFAVDKAGNQVQLWRGYCTSWEEWILKYKELKIPVLNVSVDGGFKPDEVLKMAARHAELHDEVRNGKPTGRKFYATWTMMRGDDAHSFRWRDGYRRIYSESQPEKVPLEKSSPDGRTRTIAVDVNVIRWSNFRVKNELDGILRGAAGKPKLTVLPDNSALLSDKTRAMEQGNFTWQRQMEAEILGREGKYVKWLPVHKEKHYRDCLGMGIVKMLQAGLLGATAATEEAAEARVEDRR